MPKEQECHNHSPDGDSSSDYVNNTSEEEDYDKGLTEEEEGIPYYIRYCPEDDSYLESMDCNREEYLAHGAHHTQWTLTGARMQWSRRPRRACTPMVTGLKAARTTLMANCPSRRM
ncbi:amyloid-beta A4 precursor protein-binding family A member 2-like, partial [Pongo pygmaeus]|uniref:amyloid-beta A4 precursor protein-binding family A member 2-like n=1 Tax=Pongo pygmaeus TaxID=9600 RepID=UPI00300C1FF3